ncbi:hypothetical protein PC128_g26783 [Phytophthora cactorum]|nr:hypothetical protein PC128_g26783 [Phytophthora cactorum]
MPTDYGSDISDVPMEDGEVPSSAADSESAAVAHEPVTGSRRPVKMIRALQVRSVRVMMKKRMHQRRLLLLLRVLSLKNALRGCQVHLRLLPGSVRLRHRTRSPYVCSAIVDDAAAQHFDPLTNQRRDYFIGLFHELRWHASKRTSRKNKVPEWVALCQSWNAFVENFNKDAKAYRARPLRRNVASRLSRGVI